MFVSVTPNGCYGDMIEIMRLHSSSICGAILLDIILVKASVRIFGLGTQTCQMTSWASFILMQLLLLQHIFINTTLYEKWYNKVMLEHYIRKFYLHKDMSCEFWTFYLHKSSQSHTQYNRILTGWRNWVKNMFVNSKIDEKSPPLRLFSSPVCKIATEHKYLNHDSR